MKPQRSRPAVPARRAGPPYRPALPACLAGPPCRPAVSRIKGARRLAASSGHPRDPPSGSHNEGTLQLGRITSPNWSFPRRGVASRPSRNSRRVGLLLSDSDSLPTRILLYRLRTRLGYCSTRILLRGAPHAGPGRQPPPRPPPPWPWPCQLVAQPRRRRLRSREARDGGAGLRRRACIRVYTSRRAATTWPLRRRAGWSACGRCWERARRRQRTARTTAGRRRACHPPRGPREAQHPKKL